jgi:hypothetical protein
MVPDTRIYDNSQTLVNTTDISQYRLRFGSSLLYKSVFHLNRLTAQLSYEGRAAVVARPVCNLTYYLTITY